MFRAFKMAVQEEITLIPVLYGKGSVADPSPQHQNSLLYCLLCLINWGLKGVKSPWNK